MKLCNELRKILKFKRIKTKIAIHTNSKESLLLLKSNKTKLINKLNKFMNLKLFSSFKNFSNAIKLITKEIKQNLPNWFALSKNLGELDFHKLKIHSP